MRVNFGSGSSPLDGFINIDAVPRKDGTFPDMLYAANFDKEGYLVAQIPLRTDSALEVHAYHVIEHVYRWEANALVNEWKRLLVPGGMLVLELPNIDLAARNLQNGLSDQLTMWAFYGDPQHKDPFMCHKWGYTPKTITDLLKSCGLKNIQVLPPVTHGARANRDMRVVCSK